MRLFNKLFLILLLSALAIGALDSCKAKGGAYNPYLNDKNKPSEIQAKETNRIRKQQNRAIKKQAQGSRKLLFGRKTAPKE